MDFVLRMKILEVKNLNIVYKNNGEKHEALKDINFSLDFGDFLCIVGNNGAGKSTLVKSILGLIRTNSGIVVFNNLKKSEISYVPQFNSIFASMPVTAKEVVLTGTLKPNFFSYFYSKDSKSKVSKYLRILKIENLLTRKLSDLSGGQIKKVLLARALCSEPKILILDEPCANLDENSSLKFYDILKNLNKVNNITIIIVIHDVDYAKKLGNKILFIEKGKIKQLENITNF